MGERRWNVHLRRRLRHGTGWRGKPQHQARPPAKWRAGDRTGVRSPWRATLPAAADGEHRPERPTPPARPSGDPPRRTRAGRRFRQGSGWQSSRLEGAMERQDPTRRGRPSLAGHGRCGVFLPEQFGASVLAGVDFDLRIGDLARLSLLLRARDVGRGDIRRSPAFAAATRGSREHTGLPLPKPRRRSQQREDARPKRAPVPLGKRPLLQ